MTRPSASDAFDRAVRAFNRGKLAKAAALCEDALRAAPGHFDALHLHGVVTSQLGRPEAIGGGVEVLISPHWSVRAEYLHVDLGTQAFAMEIASPRGLTPAARHRTLKPHLAKTSDRDERPMSDNKPSPADALAKLKRGNEAYAAGSCGGHTIDDAPRRKDLADKQEPFAAIVSCSDSRVPAERLFDQGVPDLFLIRNAGNTATDTGALGSIQYAVAALGVPLVVVMGHQRCGAVKAATDVVTTNTAFPGAIGRMIEPILPSVLEVRDHGGDIVDNAVRANVRRMVEHLKTDPILAEKLAAKAIAIVGARYDLDHGTVEFFADA